MASANVRVYLASLVTLAIAYFLFLVWDHKNYDFLGQKTVVDSHLKNVQDRKHFDGLIIGGSNSSFSLSATELSIALGERWYNASLMNEGHSNNNSNNFIKDIGRLIERDSVKHIVYSSMYIMRPSDIEQRNNKSVSVYGSRPLSLKPYRSALSYLREHALGENHIVYPRPTPQGDFNFAAYRCRPSSAGPTSPRTVPDDTVANFLSEGLRQIHHTFPNARIFIVIPSELELGESALDVRTAAKELQQKLVDIIHVSPDLAGLSFQVIAQPDFTSAKQVCDSVLHANEQGRHWRTTDLLSQLRALKAIKG